MKAWDESMRSDKLPGGWEHTGATHCTYRDGAVVYFRPGQGWFWRTAEQVDGMVGDEPNKPVRSRLTAMGLAAKAFFPIGPGGLRAHIEAVQKRNGITWDDDGHSLIDGKKGER